MDGLIADEQLSQSASAVICGHLRRILEEANQ